MRRLIWLLGILALAGCGAKPEPEAARPLRLALDFVPNAVHAPVFAAERAGSVKILRPGPSPDSLKLVLSGRADVGLLDIHDFGLALEKGRDVVAVCALITRPLAALAVQEDIRRPADLEGERIGVSGLPSDPAFVRAIMESDGADFERAKLVTIGFSAVPQLLQRNVAAVPVFWNAEGVALEHRGWKGRFFKVDDYGAPVYPEVVVFARRATLERRRTDVDALVRAIELGIAEVQGDPAAAAAEIAEAGDAALELTRAQLDATLPLFGTRLDRKVLEEWARFDERLGIVKKPLDITNAFRF